MSKDKEKLQEKLKTIDHEKLYGSYDDSFMKEVSKISGCDRIPHCIQCGSCSGSCPSSGFMEHPPRQLFAMIRAGMKEEVLKSTTLWYCVSCYNCYVRCPKEIRITDIMYALKSMSMKNMMVNSKFKSPKFAQQFVETVRRFGRINEFSFMRGFYLKTNIFDALKNTPFAIKLKLRGRMPLLPKKVKKIDELNKIIDTIEKGGK